MTAGQKPEKSKAGKLAFLVRSLGLARGRFRLGKSVLLAGLMLGLAVFFIWQRLAWFWIAGLILFAAGLVSFDLVVLKKTARVNLTLADYAAGASGEAGKKEHILAGIPAVLQYGKVRSVAFLETGRVLKPENALLITSEAIWALTVPLPGVDKVVAGVDIGRWQWLTASEDISCKLFEMMHNFDLAGLLAEAKAQKLMSWSEMRTVKAQDRSQAISLTRKDGKKYSYAIRQKKDYLKAKKIFQL